MTVSNHKDSTTASYTGGGTKSGGDATEGGTVGNGLRGL